MITINGLRLGVLFVLFHFISRLGMCLINYLLFCFLLFGRRRDVVFQGMNAGVKNGRKIGEMKGMKSEEGKDEDVNDGFS
jgi:hypothetical protein